MDLLIIDDGWPSAFLLAHELSRRGHRVHRLGTRWVDPLFLSGLASQSRVAHPDSDRFLPAVERAVARTGATVVMPLFEPALYRLWDAGPRWAPLLFPRTEVWQQQLVRSKGRLAQFAADLGLVAPQQRWLHTPADLAAAGESLGYPMVIKGDTGLGGDRVRMARTANEAELAVLELGAGSAGGLVAQQFIPGPTWMATGLFLNGTMLRYYAAEKLALDPPERGQATSVRSDDDPALADATRRIFEGLRWTGLAHADFIRDRAGAFQFLEVNPRPWGSITTASDSGVELFDPFTAVLEGREVSADQRFVPGVVSVVGPNRLRSQVRLGTVAGLLSAIRDREAWRSLRHFPIGVRLHLGIRMLLIWAANAVRNAIRGQG